MKARCAVLVAVALASCPATAPAQTTTFVYTGTEQTYVVPDGYYALHVRASGAPGGAVREPAPPADNGFNKGRGALVQGDIRVTPGQALFVAVGGSGGLPDGGFNGGGRGGDRFGIAGWGGGGATDIRTISRGQGAASLESRLVVAAGGGGASSGGTIGGGEAGFAGACCGPAGDAAQPGTQTEGGAGGACGGAAEGCGTPGAFGFGGDGGGAGTPPDWITPGGGGGGGWFGGGGGPGQVNNFGGGAGGSSKRPGGGTVGLADLSLPPQMQVTPIPAPPTACTDGADNDADGLVDHPADPGCADADDEDEWQPDTLPPDAGVLAPRTQKLGRSVNVEVRCLATAEDCIVSTTGTLSVGRAGPTYQLKRVRAMVVPRGQKASLRPGIPRATRAAAMKALRARGRIHANVIVRVADETGNVRQIPRKIRLVRGSR